MDDSHSIARARPRDRRRFNIFRDGAKAAVDALPDAENPLEEKPPPIGKPIEVEDPSKRFPLVAFDNIRMSTTNLYLVKGLLPRRGLGVFWGAPKCGKSF